MADESLIAEIKIALKNGLTLSEFGALASYPNQKAVEKALLIVEKQGRERIGQILVDIGYYENMDDFLMELSDYRLEQALKEGV